jgi:ATP-dependent RNA helicase DDX1
MPAFEELGLAPEILRAVDEMDWLLPSPIQDEAIPLILGGGDVMAAAETGSGKTGAFGIPVVQVVQETLREKQLGKGGPARAAAKVGASSASSSKATTVGFSTEDRDAIFAVSPSGLDIQARAARSWSGGRATAGVTGGKFYYEACVNDEGLCRIGWSTAAASYDLGTDTHGYGYGGTGKKSNKKAFDSYGGTYGKGDIIGCYIDFVGGVISYTKNGEDLGVAFKLPKAHLLSALYPAVVLKNAEMSVNFGAMPFEFPPTKAGFCGVANAPSHHLVSDAAGGGGGGKEDVKERTGALALILEPTRDLAEQVYQQMTSFAKYLVDPQVHHVCLVGGGGIIVRRRRICSRRPS